ncbi:MAG: TCP-1/cpn60 chaperonin family protein, partial [Candidatus Nitrosotenuis sp.]
REQLAVEKFAEALEAIPISLARNAGMNPIDAITQLRAKQSAGEKYTGVDVINGSIGNIEKIDVLEPVRVKEQVIKSATETANMILRIDNVVAVSRTPAPSGQMPNQPPPMY